MTVFATGSRILPARVKKSVLARYSKLKLRLSMITSKLVKSAIFILLLIAASSFLGSISNQIGRLGGSIFSASLDSLYLFLRLLLALALVAITAGLVAALVRPLWMCLIAFTLSGLAVFLIWGLNLLSIVLAVLYLLAGFIYSQGVIKGINERINFSVRPIRDNQNLLLLALIIAACALFYAGYSAQIESEGFTMPPFIIDMTIGIAEGQIEGNPNLTPPQRAQAIAEFRKQFEQQMADMIEPYQQLIPVSITLSLLSILITILSLFSWLPLLLLRAIFALLTVCRVTREVTETAEVTRLTIG